MTSSAVFHPTLASQSLPSSHSEVAPRIAGQPSLLPQPGSDLEFIVNWVAPGSHILDVGCGDGAVLAYLQGQRGCSGYGVEINTEAINQCLLRGVNVLQHDVETGLGQFSANSFDSVLCLSAMQMVKHVEAMLDEFGRVAPQVIVSFPNFGYWRHRIALLRGRMPISRALPYQWYDTPNIRCATILDFAALVSRLGFRIEHQLARCGQKRMHTFPNWRSDVALFHLRRSG